MLRMRNRTGDRWIIGVLLAAGFALRLLLLHFRPPVSGDALVYGDIASNLLHHGRYALTSDGAVKATLIRLPGYPLFLAFCFALFGTGNFLAVVSLQVVIDVVSCCLLALLAYDLAGRHVGSIALALFMLCPFTANYSVVPLTETLSIFCVALGFLALERWAASSNLSKGRSVWFALLACSASFAALLRPDRILLFVVLFGAVLWTSFRSRSRPLWRRFAPALLLPVIVAGPLCAWSARNWSDFHVFQPLAPKYANDPGEEVALGFMRWYRTWGITYANTVEVYWVYDGSLLSFADIPPRAFDSPQQRSETQQLVDRYNQETSSTPAVDSRFAALAQQRISAHPLRYYLVLPLARLADMWLQPRTELLKMPLIWWHWKDHPVYTLFSSSYAALNLGFLVVAAMGCLRWRKKGFSPQPVLAWSMLAFVLLRSALLATLDNAEQRYTIDCYPIVILLAALAFVERQPSAEPASLRHR